MRKFLSSAFALVLTLGIVFGAQSQQRVLRGKVTASTDGLPMPGVTILDKSNQTGTTTNVDGEYSISVTEKSVLVFSFIGFTTKEFPVANLSELNVVLDEDASELSEVVVTALGISKEKESLGYSLTEVGSESITKARETNVANSLAGRVAGLVVKGTSSGPGGTSKVTLRGTPSINGTGSPLYVINGVPMDNTQRGGAGEWGGGDAGDGIGNLSPDDIETMTVLKGQAASALYGTRASNGVILITTKTGKKGGDWSLTYNLNYMVEKPIDFTDFQNVYGQGTGGVRPATATDAQTTGRFAWGERMDGGNVIGFDGNMYPYSPSSDRYIDFYRTGSNATNTVSVSKGLGTDGSFRMSVSNLKSKSIVPNSDVNRLSLNMNVDQNITDKLNVTAMINYLDQQSDNIPFLSDGPKNPNNFLFLAPNIRQSIFAPGYNAATGAETVFSDDIYVTNPYFIVNQGINDQGRKRTISALSTKYSFTKDIYAMVRVGNDVSNDDFFSVDPYGLAYSTNLQGNLNSRGQSTRSELNIDGLLGGKFNLLDGLTLDALLGGNIRKNKFESVGVGGSRFVLPYLYSPFNVEAFNRSYSFSQLEVHSGFYSLDFGVKDFLTLSTTGRYDVYSSLTSPYSDDNSIFSPSVSAAFLFGDFLKIPALDFGKLRASYAVTSGEPGQAYINQFYYSSANSYNGVPAGSSPTSLPNLFLKPFTTDEIEVGLDLNFFKNRLGFDLAYYTKTTHNEIMNATMSIATGFNSATVATGSIRNRGIEALVTGKPIQTTNFTWTTSFNFTKVKNEVLSTDANNGAVNLGQNRATLGNAVTAYVVGEAGPQIRAYDYQYNEDGSIKVDESGLPLRGDLINMGSALPTLYGGWNNEFNYKKLSFSFLLDYNYGNKVLSATEYYSIFRGLNQITLEGRETGVTHDGITATAEDYYRALAQNVTRTSVVDGDFIKLRQVTLGYSLPASWFGNTPVIKGLEVSFVARNLFYLTKKAKNIDPEASFGSNINYAGIEGTALPSTRSFGFNLNFKLN